jgi:hypothetical protein
MLSEACATGKPVRIFDLGGMRDPRDETRRDFRLGGALYAFMLRWLWKPLSRDITLVHSRLRETGCAAWMDEVLVSARVPGSTDLQRAVEAVRNLFNEG